jgi:hypothetical protein
MSRTIAPKRIYNRLLSRDQRRSVDRTADVIPRCPTQSLKAERHIMELAT